MEYVNIFSHSKTSTLKDYFNQTIVQSSHTYRLSIRLGMLGSSREVTQAKPRQIPSLTKTPILD